MFITKEWIDLLFKEDIGYFYQLDFRSSATGMFQLLNSLCSIMNRTIKNGIDNMLRNAILSPQVLSPISLNQQIQAQSQLLQISTNKGFQRLLKLVRTHGKKFKAKPPSTAGSESEHGGH